MFLLLYLCITNSRLFVDHFLGKRFICRDWLSATTVVVFATERSTGSAGHQLEHVAS